MKVECKKCHFAGDADEESLVEEGGECYSQIEKDLANKYPQTI